MIIMDVRIDNMFAFKNFNMNMSYPKKIVNSTIEGEFLPERPNFRYRKVNIIMGSNATGKTTLARILMSFANYLRSGNYFEFAEFINDVSQNASFQIDFVGINNRLYRFYINIEKNTKDDKEEIICTKKIEYVDIKKSDRYETCADRLQNGWGNSIDYKDVMVNGWSFQYGDKIYNQTIHLNDDRYTNILEWVMKTLDPSVEKIVKVTDTEDTYVIRMNNRDIVVQNGNLMIEDTLSSGTKRGFYIAYAIASMMFKMHNFYFCDELFTYVNSDIEMACLSLLIDKIPPYGQLFFTTHNSDIAEMDLPKHAFCFFKKNKYEPYDIAYVNASDYLKKSTESVKNALDNDVFSSEPDVEKIYAIADLNI